MALTFERHPQDPPLASSINLIKEVTRNNPFWLDVSRMIEDRIGMHQQVLETSNDMNEIIRSQAIIANCRDILDLPERFIAELQTAQP